MNCTRECLKCGYCGSLEILDTFAWKSDFEPRSGFGIVIDIGTTNVVVALHNLKSGGVIALFSCANPQREYGADVISRIEAANKGYLTTLQNLITEAISIGIDTTLNHGLYLEKIYLENVSKDKEALTSHAKIDKNTTEIVIAGNTTMIHLLLGASCESLGQFPFKPAFKIDTKYELFGQPTQIIPWFSAFVGGDILAGLVSVLPRGKKRFLLIDLGTNGEIVLYNNGSLIVTATAAGPAFEGSGSGYSASMILDNLAKLICDGVIDATGLITDNFDPSMSNDSVTKTSPLTFTQKEVRDLQLAKSAVRSGLEILLNKSGLNYNDLDSVFLAGGIGQAMNVDSAITVGLLPIEIKEKVVPVGNVSLAGAVRFLLSPNKAKNDMETLLANFTEVNLAECEFFNELFMKYLSFS